MRKFLSMFLIHLLLSQPVFAEKQLQELVLNKDFQTRFNNYYSSRDPFLPGAMSIGGKTNELISFLLTTKHKSKDKQTKIIAQTLLDEIGVTKLLNVYNKYYDLPSSRKFIEKRLKKLDLLKIIQRYQSIDKAEHKPGLLRRYPQLGISLCLLPIIAKIAEMEVEGTSASFRQLSVVLARKAFKNAVFDSIGSVVSSLPFVSATALKFLTSFKNYALSLCRFNEQDSKTIEDFFQLSMNCILDESFEIRANNETKKIQFKNYPSEGHEWTQKFCNYGKACLNFLQSHDGGGLKEMAKKYKHLSLQWHPDKAKEDIPERVPQLLNQVKELIQTKIDEDFKLDVNGMFGENTLEDKNKKPTLEDLNKKLNGVKIGPEYAQEVVLANLVKIAGVVVLTSFLASVIYNAGQFAYNLLVLFKDRHHAPHNKKLNKELYTSLERIYTTVPQTFKMIQLQNNTEASATAQVTAKKQVPKWRRWLTGGA